MVSKAADSRMRKLTRERCHRLQSDLTRFGEERRNSSTEHFRELNATHNTDRRKRCELFKLEQPVRTDDNRTGIVKEIDKIRGIILIKLDGCRQPPVSFSSLAVHPTG